MKGTIPSVRISLDELSLGERGLRLDTCMVTATTRVYVKYCFALQVHIHVLIRLWDTCFSECDMVSRMGALCDDDLRGWQAMLFITLLSLNAGREFEDFFVYVCAALLCNWSSELQVRHQHACLVSHFLPVSQSFTLKCFRCSNWILVRWSASFKTFQLELGVTKKLKICCPRHVVMVPGFCDFCIPVGKCSQFVWWFVAGVSAEVLVCVRTTALGGRDYINKISASPKLVSRRTTVEMIEWFT